MLRQFLVVFLFRVELEIHNVTFIPLDGFVVANVDFVGTLRNESHVVRNHEHATLIGFDAPCQGINGWDVQWIGWFIQHEQMGSFVRNNRKNNAGFLTGRQLFHDLTLHRACATVSTQKRPYLLQWLFGHDFLLEIIQRRHGQVQFLFKMLSKSTDFQMLISLDLTLGRKQITRHELNQCCLTANERPMTIDREQEQKKNTKEVRSFVHCNGQEATPSFYIFSQITEQNTGGRDGFLSSTASGHTGKTKTHTRHNNWSFFFQNTKRTRLHSAPLEPHVFASLRQNQHHYTIPVHQGMQMIHFRRPRLEREAVRHRGTTCVVFFLVPKNRDRGSWGGGENKRRVQHVRERGRDFSNHFVKTGTPPPQKQ